MDNLPYHNNNNNNGRQNVNHPIPNDLGNAGVQQALDALLLQSRGLTPNDITNFMDHLELLMKDCSQANIQAGKNWVVNHCQNPQQYDLLSRTLVAISISRNSFNDKLHIVYLTNDILSHSERKQQRWIKDAFYPHLVPILRVAYYFPGIDDFQRQRVMKVLDIWRSKDFFPPHLVDTMEADVRRPPLLPPHQAAGPIHSTMPNPPGPISNQSQYPQLHHQQHSQHSQHPPPPAHQQQHLPLHMGPWPQHNLNLAGPHQQYPPHLPPQQQFGQPIAPPAFQPTQPLQPGFNQVHPLPQQQHQQQQQQHQQHHPPFHQPFIQGNFHAPYQTPVNLGSTVPSLPPPVPPAPTHRDVLARDLSAAHMMSKIEPDAEYYEPLPAYVSIPIQKNTDFSDKIMDSLKDFLSENPTSQSQGGENVQDEGWHEGYLDNFYKINAERRKLAFSRDQKPSRRSRGHQKGEQRRGDDRGDSGSRRRSFTESRSRSRSRSMSRSRSRGRSRSFTRSRSRTRSRSISRSISPQYRGKDKSRSRNRGRSRSAGRGRTRSRSMDRDRSPGRGTSRNFDRRRDRSPPEEAFPARSFAGLGSNAGHSSAPHQPYGSQQQQQQPARPMFQPARYA
ncbi:hypothetical protein BGZ76_006483 [Entomortierella beljakovae]|nr:hypothetical protein BGZ76_006483 [Entomortierella beljakovae]